jgi:hypothetical protein
MSKHQSAIDKLFTNIHLLYGSSPWIASIGEVLVDVKSTLQLQVVVVCKWKKNFRCG